MYDFVVFKNHEILKTRSIKKKTIPLAIMLNEKFMFCTKFS